MFKRMFDLHQELTVCLCVFHENVLKYYQSMKKICSLALEASIISCSLEGYLILAWQFFRYKEAILQVPCICAVTRVQYDEVIYSGAM